MNYSRERLSVRVSDEYHVRATLWGVGWWLVNAVDAGRTTYIVHTLV